MKTIEATSNRLRQGNSSHDWNLFDPYSYLEHNFSQIGPTDEEVIGDITKFYKENNPSGKFLEVGAGSNMYPILSALPFANQIEVWEFGAKNIEYLRGQCVDLDPVWQIWIDKLRQLDTETYGSIYFQQQLRDKVTVIKRSIFDLPKREYDNISMHAVAESLTGRKSEFRRAVTCFIDAGKPGATMVASFVANSHGYDSPGRRFPAVPIGAWDVVKILGPAMDLLSFGNTKEEFRPGCPLIKTVGRLK